MPTGTKKQIVPTHGEMLHAHVLRKHNKEMEEAQTQVGEAKKSKLSLLQVKIYAGKNHQARDAILRYERDLWRKSKTS